MIQASKTLIQVLPIKKILLKRVVKKEGEIEDADFEVVD